MHLITSEHRTDASYGYGQGLKDWQFAAGGTGSVHKVMHMLGMPLVKQQSLAFLTQTWRLGQSKVESQKKKVEGQHRCTQRLRPSVVLIQAHAFRVFVQRLQSSRHPCADTSEPPRPPLRGLTLPRHPRRLQQPT